MRALVLCCFCAVAGASPAFAQDAFDRPYWLDRAVIETIGRAQVVVPADEASFSVTFREVASDSRAAMFAASDRARLATAAMRSRGGDAVSVASATAVEAIYEEYRNREGERVSSERADQIANYSVSVTLNVRVTNVALAADVRASAMAVGPQETGDLNYALTETAPARLRAYRAAVQDAATRARVSAEASGAVLGRLLVLQEGQGPCLGRWMGGPSRNRAAMQESMTPVTTVEDEVVVTGSRARTLRLSAEDIARMQLPSDMAPLELSAQVCAVYAVGP